MKKLSNTEADLKKSVAYKKRLYETLCAIWYHLYNLKNVKNRYFSRFLNCTNGTESLKASHVSLHKNYEILFLNYFPKKGE